MKPIIALSMGDPAGIGPEIIIKALTKREIAETAAVIVAGDAGVLRAAMEFPGVPGLSVNCVEEPAQGDFRPGILNVIDLKQIDAEKLKLGEVCGDCGAAAYAYIRKGAELCLEGRADALVTAPINKESLRKGGVEYIGHTEILGALTGTADPLTMFEVRGMRIFFLSRHLSLRQACDAVTAERIMDYVRRCTEALRCLGVSEGVMAVAGLNPHSGEHGLFGSEEVEQVAPAVEALRREGYAVEGPVGADSVFHLALQGRYNSVLSLYHDQGHIAAKTYDFARTIAITNGLPFLRTSVDHGTAMDIAGQGRADSVSMEEAIRLAVKYAPAFGKRKYCGQNEQE